MATPKARIMPHNIDAEQAVLGAVLIDENVPANVMGLLKPEDFYTDSHREIFRAMQNVYNRNSPIDYITLNDELENMGSINAVGGIAYITTLTSIVPSAANHMHYVDIVKNDSTMRRLIDASGKIIDEAYSGKNENILGFAEKSIFDISLSEDKTSLEKIDNSLNNVMAKFETIGMDANAFRGIPTGYPELDKVMHGLQPSDLIIIAARPGVGKTSLGMNLVEHAALASKQGKGKNERYACAVFSLEMSVDQIVQRMLCAAANVSMSKALNGSLEMEEWNKLFAAKARLHESELYIDDSSLITPREILSKCRRLKRKSGLDLIMIDYLQLMTPSNSRADNRQQEISEITRTLKVAAKELNVPILLLSQLSRASEKRQGASKVPVLSDLRESGAIEQDADIVMFIHREYMASDTTMPDSVRNKCDLVIAKHRNGELTTIPMYWKGDIVSFLPYDSKDAKLNMQVADRIFRSKMPEQDGGDVVEEADSDYVAPDAPEPEKGEKGSFIADDNPIDMDVD